MPVHKYSLESKHERNDLVAEVANELLSDSGHNVLLSPDAPEIFIDATRGHRGTESLRVWVVWEKWNGVPEVQRAGVILDAFEKADRKEEAEKITIAMGLTRDEAAALGLAV